MLRYFILSKNLKPVQDLARFYMLVNIVVLCAGGTGSVNILYAEVLI